MPDFRKFPSQERITREARKLMELDSSLGLCRAQETIIRKYGFASMHDFRQARQAALMSVPDQGEAAGRKPALRTDSQVISVHPHAREVEAYCRWNLDLLTGRLPDEYFYQHLALCILDAEFSINSNYSAAQNVVWRYSNAYKLTPFRSNRKELPAPGAQEPLSLFVQRAQDRGTTWFMENVLDNRCMTHPLTGIRKAEAATMFASILVGYGIEYFQDIPVLLENPEAEAALRAIPNHSSGVMLDYFLMLAGVDSLIKHDRMVSAFLEGILKRRVSSDEALEILQDAALLLMNDFPEMTPRLLDYLIWQWQRSHRGVFCR